ncbi:MAG: hypothetical protein IKO80_09560 [Lachnospiraceae bacterium]|nr:hypothetical protein [Lachnospiraceae bacterium]
MIMKQGKKKQIAVLAAVSLMLMFTAGCGDQTPDPLDVYCEEMDAFYTEVGEIDGLINGIDPDSPDATEEFLTQMDRLDALFTEMSGVEIPEEFETMEDLPAEAADYMTKAVAAFHDAYDGDFDENAESLARQYYDRANIRIRYMLAILHDDADMISEEGAE